MVVSGTVTLDGTALDGAKVTAIDTGGGTVLGTATTAADGTYSIDVGVETTVHCLMEYTAGDGTQYNDYSKPFVHHPAETLVIDDFEWEGPVTDRYQEAPWITSTNSLDRFSISPTTPLEGSYSLYWTEYGSGTGYEITNLDGQLPHTPQRGDTFQILHRRDQWGNWQYCEFRWGLGWDGTNLTGYWIRLRPGQDELILRKYTGSGTNHATLDQSTYTNALVDSTTYRFEITFGDPTITVAVIDPSDGTVMSSVSADDTDYDSGPISIFERDVNEGATSPDNESWWDGIRTL